MASTGVLPERRVALLREPGLGALWSADLVSQLGSQITVFVLPLLMLGTLHAGAGQVGLLQAVYTAPLVVLPLLGGSWLDRRRKRPVMITCDLVRAALVAALPVLSLAGVLTVPLVYAVALLAGGLSVLYDIAATSFLPHVAPRHRLADANGALSVNQAVGATAGPALGGWLAALLGPGALLVDAGSYLLSAAGLSRVRHREPAPAPSEVPRLDVRTGLAGVFGNPPLRALVLHAAAYNLVIELVTVGFLVYFVHDLGHSASAYGVVMAAGGVGAAAGAVTAPRLIRLIGFGPTAVTGLAFSTTSYLLLPGVTGDRGGIALAALAFFLATAGAVSTSVVAATLRQLLTEPSRYARVSAAYRLAGSGTLPLGGLLAGVLVDGFGARTVLWLAPFGLMLSALPVLAGPLRGLKLPAHPREEEPA